MHAIYKDHNLLNVPLVTLMTLRNSSQTHQENNMIIILTLNIIINKTVQSLMKKKFFFKKLSQKFRISVTLNRKERFYFSCFFVYIIEEKIRIFPK